MSLAFPKTDHFRSEKLTRSARGRPCSNCGAEDGTTVWAHSNNGRHGKGKSIKAHDCFGADLCFRCHAWLDQGAGMDPTKTWHENEKGEMFMRAFERSLVARFQDGTYKVTGG